MYNVMIRGEHYYRSSSLKTPSGGPSQTLWWDYEKGLTHLKYKGGLRIARVGSILRFLN